MEISEEVRRRRESLGNDGWEVASRGGKRRYPFYMICYKRLLCVLGNPVL